MTSGATNIVRRRQRPSAGGLPRLGGVFSEHRPFLGERLRRPARIYLHLPNAKVMVRGVRSGRFRRACATRNPCFGCRKTRLNIWLNVGCRPGCLYLSLDSKAFLTR